MTTETQLRDNKSETIPAYLSEIPPLSKDRFPDEMPLMDLMDPQHYHLNASGRSMIFDFYLDHAQRITMVAEDRFLKTSITQAVSRLRYGTSLQTVGDARRFVKTQLDEIGPFQRQILKRVFGE